MQGTSTLIHETVRASHLTMSATCGVRYEHVIQRTIQNIEAYDFWDLHCNNMLILDRERRKRRGKGQANSQILKLQRELRLAITIDVSILLFIEWQLFSQFPANY